MSKTIILRVDTYKGMVLIGKTSVSKTEEVGSKPTTLAITQTINVN